ncbi:DMSO reductase [Halorhabdus sp. CBA1104]|uniref:ethylbenzene dehydrogenase-related protein n=1 Tax=Halorhabdus sp. CBA1104 TaxID=1380432 RepID=UPI0012B257B0|nr:ethylbenzene dehydrogenase-related protein [Halorhabdus sp. CBA1104]QGN08275.1 DMSO reductase [Halorhabdus sp. CBA1104]
MTDAAQGRRPLLVAGLLAGLLVASAALVPLIADARPAREIPVENVDGSLADPGADGWSDVPAATIPLASAPSGVPNADDTSVRAVEVEAATTDDTLFVRLRWADSSTDRQTSSPRAFADMAAIQFPVNATTQPAIAMGSQSNLVNVWQWTGTGTTQELLAGGPGSTTAFEQPQVSVEATRTTIGEDGGWSVVFTRALNASVDNRTQLAADADLNVAFGVWNGENSERAGQKAVSEWYYFPFGPAEDGAPFQTILWAVAGIAIALVIAVTAISVRRAGQEAESG